MSNHLAERQTFTDRVAKSIRWLCVPIVLLWVAVAALTNVLVPQLEAVGEVHNVALSSPDSPSLQAFQRIGKVFGEFDSDSAAMVVLEGDQPLGADAHRYYDELVKRFEADPKHIEHVQDFWGDPLTAAGSQSPDGKAAYVQVFLSGNQGEALSLESVDALRQIIAKTPAPPGIHAYVAGSAAQIADQFEVGNEGTVMVTLLTVGVIALMLLIVYRSPVTMILALVTVLIEMSAARGIVAFLANAGVIGLSTYSTNILTLLVIAAGTDYMIFLLGRYQERRNEGFDREAAFYDMYRGTSHVILGSGLTIAGAVFCLSFTRCRTSRASAFRPRSACSSSLVASLTLAPAVIVIGGRFGLLEPKRRTAKRGWRRIGTAIVRWPGPILIATLAVAFVGLAALSGYKVELRHRRGTCRPETPSNVGYAAAERHFSKARLNPELLMIETDHDLRNPTDMILLERVAKAVFHTDGIAQVQSITRPLGTPLDHTSIPFQISTSSAAQINNLPFQQDRAADLLKQVGVINDSIEVLRQQYALQQQSSDVTDEQAKAFKQTVATAQDLRDKIANFDDFFRPLRNYFYWEPHCFDIPVCCGAAVDVRRARRHRCADRPAGQRLGQHRQARRTAAETARADPAPDRQSADQPRPDDDELRHHLGDRRPDPAALQNSTALGQAYDASKTDDSFYLPPEAFTNPEFLRGLKLFLSPDGKAARMIITHDVRSRDARGHLAHRRDPARRAGGGQGNTVGRVEDLHRRYGGHLQGHSGHGALRPDHRRHRLAEPDPADHDVHHPQPGRRARHRGHRGAVAWRLVRPVGAGLAGPPGHPVVLGGAAFGRHPAVGGGIGLQPAAGVPVQGGDPRRHQHRHHPVHGRQRLGRDRRRTGVRLHHGVVHLQRPAGARPDRHDDRARPAVRHADRAVVHDTVHRRAARAVVLVAGAGAPTAGTPEVRRRGHAPAFAVLNERVPHRPCGLFAG